MNYFQFYGKKVKIIADDGQEIVGTVKTYYSAIDNDEGMQSISLDTGLPGTLTCVFENEIASIEVIN